MSLETFSEGENLLARLRGIQKSLEKGTNPFLLKLEAKLQKEFVDVSV